MMCRKLAHPLFPAYAIYFKSCKTTLIHSCLSRIEQTQEILLFFSLSIFSLTQTLGAYFGKLSHQKVKVKLNLCGSYAEKRCNVELFPSTFVIHV